MRRTWPAAALLRVAFASALLVGLFYLVPVESNIPTAQLWLRGAICVLGIVFVSWLVTHQIRRQFAAGGLDAPLVGLLIALVSGVLFFALMDYAVAEATAGQFIGLDTRTDALYFALSTLGTVGFGDVHAQSQAARILVIIQILFNLVLITAGGSVLVNQITERVRRARQGAAPPQEEPPVTP